MISSFCTNPDPKNLDPSYKMDLDLWDCFRKGKTSIIAKFLTTDLVICSHSREGETPSYNQINTVEMHLLDTFAPFQFGCTFKHTVPF